MKHATTSRKSSSERVRREKRLIANAPAKVKDPDCPYDPNDAKAIADFWQSGIVVRGGSIAGVRAALAQKRKPGQRGLGQRPAKIAINIRLSPEVLNAFKSTGAGWQTRVDGALKDWLKRHEAA